MRSDKPRVGVAVAYARSYASLLIGNATGGFLQEGTRLTDEEAKIAEQELVSIQKQIEASINQELLPEAI